MQYSNNITFGEVVSVNFKDDVIENTYSIIVKLYDYNNKEISSNEATAIPLDMNIKHVPVNGEIVMLIKAPSSYSSASSKIMDYYYINPISIHYNNHHNSLPKLTKIIAETSNDYSEVEAGNENKKIDNFKFGETFEEKSDVNNLQVYEGDVIVEGRWGNSIRLSSSVVGGDYSKDPFWTAKSSDGSPIIAIRNGQGDQAPAGKFVTENINDDDTSIYLTKDQTIELTLSSDLFDSYDQKPIDISKFNESQILGNSNRIVLNAKTDSIILSSEKSISLTTNGTFNVDSQKKSVLNSPEIYLGAKDAEEPLLFGNKTDDWLNELLDVLDDVLVKLSTHFHPTGVGPSGPPSPPEAIDFSTNIPLNVTTIRQKIIQLKSTRNFTL